MSFALRQGVCFASESWHRYVADAEPLWVEHHAELAKLQPRLMAMDVDVLSYKAFDQAGMLHITTARREGRLVGYCLVLVKRHLHYAELCGFEDSYFLTLAERRGATFYRMMRHTLAMLARRGVRNVYFMTKVSGADMSPLFTRLGFVLTDKVFALSLEG